MDVLIKRILILATAICAISACMPTEEVWTGKQKNPIRVVCGRGCSTLVFPPYSSYVTPRARQQIRRFIHRHPYSPIYISQCAMDRRNWARLQNVKDEITRRGYKAVVVKPTLARDMLQNNCVNLVAGKLKLYVQDCPNTVMPPSVETIGSNFGCSSSYNLAHMITNPWNLITADGDNGTEGARVGLGVKNYREGKESKLDMESST